VKRASIIQRDEGRTRGQPQPAEQEDLAVDGLVGALQFFGDLSDRFAFGEQPGDAVALERAAGSGGDDKGTR
jgi:hypothetical protein